MTATERILDAFAGLGFQRETGPGFDGPVLLGEIPGNGSAVLYAVDEDGCGSPGFPETGMACCVETMDEDGNPNGRTTFPDPVTAFVYVRDLSGWFAPLTATGEREPRPQDLPDGPIRLPSTLTGYEPSYGPNGYPPTSNPV